MTDSSASGVTPEQRRLIATLFDGLPSEFQGRHKAVLELRQEFQQQLAGQMAPALNAHIRSMPQSSLDDRREVATWANGVLHEIGLRVKSSRGLPAVIVADYVKASEPEHTARYRLIAHNEQGKVTSTDNTTGPLFELELMPARERKERFSRTSPAGRSKPPER